MEIKINFEVGVTAQLAAILKGFLDRNPMAQVLETLPEEVEEPKVAKVAKVEKPMAEKVEEPKADKPVEAKVETAAAPSAKKVTVQDVRAAMDRARTRIEGEGYKDLNPKHPLHNALTSEFKGIAALLGADKPSELPEEDRATFVKECDLLGEEEGKIVKFTSPF